MNIKVAAFTVSEKSINMLDNMLLLRKLKYVFCKCYVILKHRYVYTKRILIVILLQKLRYVSYKCNALLN